MLDASTLGVAAAGSGLIDLQVPRVVDHGTRWRNNRARVCRVWSCDEVDHASLPWICDADRLYTDAALMLDASPRVVAAAGSGLI